MSTTLRDYVPGQKQLSAAQLNELVALVKALAGLQTGEGLSLDRVGGAYQLTREEKEPGFWAKITGEGTSSLAGKYAWTEQTDASGSFANLTGGRSGTVNGVSGATTTVEPLREANGATGVPTNTIVWVIEGTPTVDTATTGDPIDSHYRFEYPAPAALEYEGYYLTSNYTLSAMGVWEEVTGWTRASDTSAETYIEFPSTGIWRADVMFMGFCRSEAGSSLPANQISLWGRLEQHSPGGLPPSEMLAPNPTSDVVDGVIANGYAATLGGKYEGVGSLHLSGIFQVNTANTQGLVISVNAQTSSPSGSELAILYANYSVGYYMTTSVILTKLSD